MAGERFTGRPDGTRRSAVWAVLGVFLLNLLLGSFAHLAASATDITGAVEICAADGGRRYVLHDGTTAPRPAQPAPGDHGCADCITCASVCGMAAGFVALAPRIDRRDIDLRLLDFSALTPQQSFPVRPLGQAPPLTLA